jgi:pSer/pThr/pTyr-binding forkhead associated (FHA) protein
MTPGEATVKLPPSEQLSPTQMWGEASLKSTETLALQFYDTGELLLLPKVEQIVIGRIAAINDSNACVDLTPYGIRAKSVSRRHAMITLTSFISIIDLASTNGTFLNGTQLIPNRPRVVRNGDELRFGELTAALYFRISPGLNQAS